MTKFIVKLSNGRKIGPISKSEVLGLLSKSYISRKDMLQQVPDGEWLPISSIADGSFQTHSQSLLKKVKKVKDEIEDEKKEFQEYLDDEAKKDFQEFVPKEKVDLDIDYEKLQIEIKEKKRIEEEQRLLEEQRKQEEEERNNSTRIITPKLDLAVNAKTIVRPLSDKEKEELLELQRQEEDDESVEKEITKSIVAKDLEKIANIEDEQTQFFNIAKHSDEIISEVSESEELILEIERKRLIDRKIKEMEMLPAEVDEELVQSQNNEKAKGKQKSPVFRIIMALAVLLIVYEVLFEDDGKKEIPKPKYVQIQSPIQKQVADSNISRQLELKGDGEFLKHNYLGLIASSNYYRQAFENDIENYNSLSKLILSYSMLLKNTKDKIKAGAKIYRLIEIAEASTNVSKDTNYVIGVATFFYEMEKYRSAISTVREYLILKKPNARMISIFLKSLIEAGEFTDARKMYDLLSSVKSKTPAVYTALSKFSINDENYEEAGKWLKEAALKFPNNLDIVFSLCNYFVLTENFKALFTLLNNLNQVGTESSIYYYSEFLKYLGIYHAVRDNTELAAKLFDKALGINESDELRSKIATLNISDQSESVTTRLVKESKSIEFLNKAQIAINNEKWDKAFKFIINAVDLTPNYLPANIKLAEVQIQRGFFSLAIEKLLKLKERYPKNADVGILLARVYIKVFKFAEARTVINGFATEEFRNSWKFSKLMGEYFIRSKNYKTAIKYLQESINRNPINDKTYKMLADIFIKLRIYDRAKLMLFKAINLNPGNVYYRADYAKILYELQDADTAIGYLRNIEKNFDNHPKILGDMAMYYYLNGRIKDFQKYKDIIEKNAAPTIDLYNFLLETAILEENDKNIVKYAKEIAKYNPGDLESKVILGEKLVELKLYDDALAIFNDVRKRLDSYPKLLYNISKLHLLRSDIESAKEYAELEIKNNPTLPSGYVLLADILVQTGEIKDAELNYRKAQSFDSNNIGAITGLAYIEYNKNNYEVAHQLYQKAVKLNPNDPILRRQLGLVYRKMGQRSLAVEAFKVYLDLKPDASDKNEILNIINSLQ